MKMNKKNKFRLKKT